MSKQKTSLVWWDLHSRDGDTKQTRQIKKMYSERHQHGGEKDSKTERTDSKGRLGRAVSVAWPGTAALGGDSHS